MNKSLTLISAAISFSFIACDAQTTIAIDPQTPKQELPKPTIPKPKNATQACLFAVWTAEAKSDIHKMDAGVLAFFEEVDSWPPGVKNRRLAENVERVRRIHNAAKLVSAALSDGYSKINYDGVDAGAARIIKEFCDAQIVFSSALQMSFEKLQALAEAKTPTEFAVAVTQDQKAFADLLQARKNSSTEAVKFNEFATPYRPK